MLDSAMKQRVRRLASARRRSPQQFLQDALAAWADYQTTGLHVTSLEADAWLAKIEAGRRAVVPKCHA
jgi:predicted transcriptional regulator